MYLTALLSSAALLLALFALRQGEPAPPPLPSSGQNIRVLLSAKPGQYLFESLEVTPLYARAQVRGGPDPQRLQPAFSSLGDGPLRFTAQEGRIRVSVLGKAYDLGPFAEVAADPEAPGAPRFLIGGKQRGDFYPEYPGRLLLGVREGRLSVVNVLDLQEYLRRVLPSEMPPNFPLEALKAQAVAARTYAYSRMTAPPERNYWKSLGADVDDSTNEQVYNGQPPQPSTDQAVAETLGQVLTYRGALVQAFYFSTSPGSTASIEEVWPDRERLAYLRARTQTNPVTVNISSERQALEFFRNWAPEGFYDGESSLFRWRVSLSRSELEAVLARTLPALRRASPEFVRTVEGRYTPDRPEFELGTLQGLKVLKRTRGGFITELEVRTSTGRYWVGRESNVRNLIRPDKRYTGGPDVMLERFNGVLSPNFPALPSAAFAWEEEREGNNLQRLTFWGGGYGHGVGMSQYGALGLAKAGKTHREILEHFYPGTALTVLSPGSKR
ncbi:SpoIID/LytB domain-containing protein [Calidithermus chliarophilus]|uniref:SpoIID/LytB domain-containing protein n=1 Tax=Calidithermus chliarophilus TaxID=52023 RepID=UPI0003FD6F71|nr:SpoIID/LytB domain-containing protein [Calidithermus chliarophilus]